MSKFNPKKDIKKYILDSINDSGYDAINENSSNKEKLQFIANNFKSEAFYINNIKKFKNNKGAIIADHLQGLPSYLNISFSNFDILQLAKKWGFTFNTEKKEDIFLEQYWGRIAQNILELFKTNKIEF